MNRAYLAVARKAEIEANQAVQAVREEVGEENDEKNMNTIREAEAMLYRAFLATSIGLVAERVALEASDKVRNLLNETENAIKVKHKVRDEGKK